MKIFNVIRRYRVQPGSVLVGSLLSTAAMAQDAGGGVDYSAITSSVSWGTVATGITGILAALVLPKVALKGGRMLLSALR